MITPKQYAYLVAKLDQARGQWPEIALSTGVNRRTIENIGGRRTTKPKLKTVQPLIDYFKRKDAALRGAARARRRRAKIAAAQDAAL